MPAPGEVGVSVAASPADWTVALARLETLGLVAFNAQELREGGWVFVCQLKTAQPGQRHRIEAGPAATKAEAIRLALVEAERRTAGR
jgi:hypothetical protein